MEIAGLVFAAVAEARYLVMTVKERYRNHREAAVIFENLVLTLETIERQMKACAQDINMKKLDVSRPSSTVLTNQFKSIEERFKSAKLVLRTLQSDIFSDKGAGTPTKKSLRKMLSRTTSGKRLVDQLRDISSDFDLISSTIIGLAGILENLNTQNVLRLTRIANNSGGSKCVSNVPALTDREVLNYDGEDVNGNRTPEAQLKRFVLSESSVRTIGISRSSKSGRLPALPCAEGMAGVGKTFGLRGLATDEDIKRQFKEIHFMSLEHDASDKTVVLELARIVRVSGGERRAEGIRNCKDVREAVQLAGRWFSDCPCLFLVDDIWKTADSSCGYLPALRQLLCSCPLSRMAISTRDRDIAIEAGQRVEFGVRDKEVSRQILINYMNMDLSTTSKAVEDNIERILGLCAGLPIALAVAGHAAKRLTSYLDQLDMALEFFVTQLEERHTSLIDEDSAEYRSLKSAMQVSLDILDKDMMGQENQNACTYQECVSSYTEKYAALCVLKTQAWAPASMLSILWGVSERETKKVMSKFCNLHLASMEGRIFIPQRSKTKQEVLGLRLHDLQQQFCQEEAEAKLIRREWHRKLLNGYARLQEYCASYPLGVGNSDNEKCVVQREQSSSIRDKRDSVSNRNPLVHWDKTGTTTEVNFCAWWSEPFLEDSYIHEYLAYHLIEAEKEDELYSLLLDVRWTKLRLKVGGILGLERDFAEMQRQNDGSHGSAKQREGQDDLEEFCMILNALRCSWNVITQNERELLVQIGSRLSPWQSSSAARKYLQSILEYTDRPFLEPLSAFLAGAKGAQMNEVKLGGKCLALAYSACEKHFLAGVGADIAVVDVNTLDVVTHFRGHEGDVTSVCCLPDSNKVVSGSDDCTLRVWDLKSSDVLTLEGHTGWVLSVCASSDGTRVASASRDHTVRLWDVRSEFAECKVLEGHESMVSVVSCSPDGKWLASGSLDKTIRLWNGQTGAATGKVIQGHKGDVTCIAFSPDGRRLVSGSTDRTIRLWETNSGASMEKVTKSHSGTVFSVSFRAHGARIVSASLDKTIRVWDARTCMPIGDALHGHMGGVECAVFNADGTRIASVSSDGTMRFWNAGILDLVSKTSESRSSRLSLVVFSDEGAIIATVFDDCTIQLWNGQNGKPIGSTLVGHTKKVTCVGFSGDETRLVSGSLDKTVRIWDVCAGDAIGGALKAHKARITRVKFSENGTEVVSYSSDGCIFVWTVVTGQLIWASNKLVEVGVNVLSEAQAEAIIKSSVAQRTTNVTADDTVVACKGNAIMLSRDKRDFRLATLPKLANFVFASWKYFPKRNDFVTVLTDGSPAIFKLHDLEN